MATLNFSQYDLTDRATVERFMWDSTSEVDWRERTEYVKASHNGNLPDFWQDAIVYSNLEFLVKCRWV